MHAKSSSDAHSALATSNPTSREQHSWNAATSSTEPMPCQPRVTATGTRRTTISPSAASSRSSTAT